MRSILQIQLEEIKKLIDEPKWEALKLSMYNVHHKGLFSLVLDNRDGKLVRVFIATREIEPFAIQIHSHRYPIALTPLKGCVVDYKAEKSDLGIIIDRYKYETSVNGGSGKISYDGPVGLKITRRDLPVGCLMRMRVSDLHTVSCSKDSMWLIVEGETTVKESSFYGVPFDIEGLYFPAAEHQIKAHLKGVSEVINSLLYKVNNTH